MPIEVQVSIDTRSFCEFFWHVLKIEHNLLNLFFYKSVINPLWKRFTLLLFQTSLDFALNAIFFTSDTINNQAEAKYKEGKDAVGFWFIITNQFWQVFWPVVISILVSTVVNVIVKVPKGYLNELNNYMVTKDLESIKEG